MSDGALNSAVSGLKAQSRALSVISDNLANSSTVGYKASDTQFSSMVETDANSNYYQAGGVSTNVVQNVGSQGTITSASSSTDLAIKGDGLFVVSQGTNTSGGVFYTRDGEFSTDANGLLCNGDYYLLGWPTDSEGNPTTSTNSVSSLQTIDTNEYSSSAEPSTIASIAANLPANATTGETFTTSMDIYDSLGTEQSIPMTWTCEGDGLWSCSLQAPTLASNTSTVSNDGSAATAVINGTTTSTFYVQFDSSGNLIATSATAPASGTTLSQTETDGTPLVAYLQASNLNDGGVIGSTTATTANPEANTVAWTLGSAGKADGFTQYSQTSGTLAVDINSTSIDGVAYGSLSSVGISSDGTVTANYTNGQSQKIFKIAMATFSNEDGLSAVSGGVYKQTAESGTVTLHVAGEGGSGVIESGSLENSTTDTATEMSKMIVAQQAYSAATQVISTTKNMFQSLISAVQ